MINKAQILKGLKKIDKLYQDAINTGDTSLERFYSKLCTIEFCGWIEESMDDLIIRHVKRKKLKENKNIKYVKKDIIGNTYGFEYKKYFRNMLIKTIGIIKLEYIEKNMNQKRLQLLKSALSTLHKERNQHSHQTIQTTKTFTAPSKTIALFNDVYEGLLEYEIFLKKLN
jgi:uncharacterized protein YihD (DUF1040 family)